MTTIAATLDAFLSDPRLRTRLQGATLHAYRHDLTTAARDLTLPLDHLTAQHIAAFLDRAEAVSTTQRRMASLRRFFMWAVREGLCAQNPLDQLEPVRAPRRLPRPITGDQARLDVDRAIVAAPQPYRLIFTILRETGMRAGEALALTIGNVALDAGREGLRIREPKNGVERMVVLGPTATPRSLRGLRAHMRAGAGQPDDAPVFRSNRGTRISYDALQYQWSAACRATGLIDMHGKPRYTLHQLRHTRATELIEQGQPMEIVQRVLGHRDPRSTQGYAELHEAQVRAALEKR